MELLVASGACVASLCIAAAFILFALPALLPALQDLIELQRFQPHREAEFLRQHPRLELSDRAPYSQFECYRDANGCINPDDFAPCDQAAFYEDAQA